MPLDPALRYRLKHTAACVSGVEVLGPLPRPDGRIVAAKSAIGAALDRVAALRPPLTRKQLRIRAARAARRGNDSL